MARGTTLVNLSRQLKLELRESIDAAHQPDWEPHLRHHLAKAQELLYHVHSWAFLKTKASIPLLADTRYYDFPTGWKVENIIDVWLIWNKIIEPVSYGIRPEFYSSFDSDAGEVSQPVKAWDVEVVAGDEQIEVWPIPESSGIQALKLVGKIPLTALDEDADTALLDDRLIVLHAAADLLEGRNASDARSKRQAANAYLLTQKQASMKANLNGNIVSGPTITARRPGRLLAPRI